MAVPVVTVASVAVAAAAAAVGAAVESAIVFLQAYEII
jgi:hypothetical protein